MGGCSRGEQITFPHWLNFIFHPDTLINLRTGYNLNYICISKSASYEFVYVEISCFLVDAVNLNSDFLLKSWGDWRLSWSNTSATSQDYSNIDSLFSTEVNVWTPALIIENSWVNLIHIESKQVLFHCKIKSVYDKITECTNIIIYSYLVSFFS